MLKKLYAILVVMLLQVSLIQAQSWTDSVDVSFKHDATTLVPTKFKVWVPTGTTTIKGIILVSGKGVGATFSNALCFNDSVRAAAASRNTALIAWFSSEENRGVDTSFIPSLQHTDSLVAALNKIGRKVNANYIANCPIFVVGTHTSATTALTAAYTASTQMIGLAVINSTAVSRASNALAQVPTLVIDGDLAGPDVSNNANVNFGQGNRLRVLARRSASEPIAHLVIRGGGYRSFNSLYAVALSRYFRSLYDLRVAPNADPTTGVVSVQSINQANTWLGSSVFGSINSTDYRVASSSSGTLTAASSFWFPTQQMANEWRASHLPAIIQDAVPNFSTINAAIPFCSGVNTSGVIVNYSSPIFAGFYNSSNVFYAELSNIYGVFDDPIVPSRVLSTLRSRSGVLSNNLANPTFIAQNADNFQADTILRSGTTTAKYRFRIRSTSPAFISDISIQIADIAICSGGFPVVLKNTPIQSLTAGQSFNLEAFRDGRVRATPFPAGTTLRVVLSDSTGSFSNLTYPLGSIATQLSTPGSSNAISIPCLVPNNVSMGLNYRIQVFADSVIGGGTAVGSTTGGVFRINANGPTVGIEENVASESIAIYPNPSKGEVNLSGFIGNAVITFTDMQGRSFGSQIIKAGQTLQLPSASGLYLFTVKTEKGTSRKMVVKE